jgi:demethoxyubiquinone hydroxylase (CLK1/Coq7/Cat5 family)
VVDERAAALGRLVAFVRREHANERGAALAYRGHWRSVSDPEERAHIARIEAEEWHHREVLAELLSSLGAAPNPWIERPLALVGATLGLLCFVTGWLAPMVGAGWIERINARGYLAAADDAAAAGRPDLQRTMLELGAIEIDHHAWFHARVRGHWLGRRLPLRDPLPRPALAG